MKCLNFLDSIPGIFVGERLPLLHPDGHAAEGGRGAGGGSRPAGGVHVGHARPARLLQTQGMSWGLGTC